VIPRVHWRRKFLEGTPLSAFGSDPERGALRIAVDDLDSRSLSQTLLRELGEDARVSIEVFDVASITGEPYTRVQGVLNNPRDMLVTEVLDDAAPYIADATGFSGYQGWVDGLIERTGVTSTEAEQLVTTIAAAQALGIDIIATEDLRLLHYFRWKNALSFRSTLALCGLYLRHGDSVYLRADDGREWKLSASFARTMAVELLAPGLVDIEQGCHELSLRAVPSELPNWRLANSAMTRTVRALRARDEVHFRTQVEESRSVSDDAAFYLDFFLVCAIGALDALARLVKRVYGLSRVPDIRCAWHNEGFLQALSERQSSFADEARVIRRPLDVLRHLRNLIHEMAPEPLVEVRQSGVDKHPLNVFDDAILTDANNAGGADKWGLSETRPGGGAYLAPDVFVEQATAELFAIMDTLTKQVELDRLPRPELAKRRSEASLRGHPHL
jgi:hypothetical protein